MGGLLSAIMAGICWYMVTNDCARMSQYRILLFGFICIMNGVLELVTLCQILQMGGRNMRTQSQTTTNPGTSTSGATTAITVTIAHHPFFDTSAGFLYNQQSFMMIASPVVALIGAALAYFCYNAFPTSLFDEGDGGGNDEEARHFGGAAQNFG